MLKIADKLNNKSGATMIMALLLLLVAITCSAVIISAAMTSAMNVKATEKDQQAYLSVSSAAEYIKTEICKGKITRTYGSTGTITDSVGTESAFSPEISMAVTEVKKKVENEIVGSKTYMKNSVFTDQPFYINISADNSKLLPVKVIFEMDRTYTITAHLSISDTNYPEYKTVLRFISKDTRVDRTHDTITWPTCTITKESGK